MLFPQFKTNPITGWQIKLPKLGSVPINLHRPIPEGFTVKQVRVVKKAMGWFAVVTISSELQIPSPISGVGQQCLAVTLGSLHYTRRVSVGGCHAVNY